VQEIQLDKRAREIFRAIVAAHVETGEPVGSRSIARSYREKLSPASIRNVMADLEAMNLLTQPHTSAGRVPTDRGYRLFVDTLLPAARISTSDERSIHESLRSGVADLPELLERASRLLSRLSHNLAIVVAPTLAQTLLCHVEFIRLDGRRAVVVFVSQGGSLHSRLVETEHDLSQEELTRMGNFLNDRLSGRSLPEVRNELLRMMSEEKAQYDLLLQQALELGALAFDDSAASAPAGVYVDGTANLLAQARSEDLENMRSLFRAFEDKHRMVLLLNQCMDSEGVRVLIGSENHAPELRDMSLVVANYRGDDRPLGTIGILGPMRMEYARAMSLVDAIARVFTGILSQRSN
jgi:heat-inducible transcriptional repressor